MSSEDGASPFVRGGWRLSRATMLLRLEKGDRPGRRAATPAAWATAFFFTDTLAMTAAHNLLLHHGGTTVRAIYKERFVELEWMRSWSDAEADVAVLRLKKRPDGIEIEPAQVAFLDPALPRAERGRFWAARTTVIFGYSLHGQSPEERRIDGMIDTELPIVDAFVGPYETSATAAPAPVQRLRIKGMRIREPRGMSGAPVLDVESGHVVAVQSSYVPDDPADPDPGNSRATEIAWLIERVPELRQHCIPLSPAGATPGEGVQHNLPSDLTRFVGRDQEVAQVGKLLRSHRLVTLTGPGGVGKTRLAIEAARRLVGTTPDGVWLVELGPLADPDLVPQSVAAGVGVTPEPGRPLLTTLAGALRRRRLLLVLDNCEHLVDAGARLAEALLRACPHLQILATSRERLRCEGEAVWRVPSFALPPAEVGVLSAAQLQRFDAIGLFAHRAAAARPGFSLTTSNARAVAEVCRRLDDIPLAIELAAAPVRGLSVEQIAARLDDRFRLLVGGNRTSLQKQQTLRATVDWSYTILSPAERQVFDRLSVFAANFTLDAAEAVCADHPEALAADAREAPDGVVAAASAAGGDAGPAAEKRLIQERQVLDLLLRLVDKSLVQSEDGSALDLRGGDGEERYRLLETLREYGRERLVQSGEEDRVRLRHLRYYLGLVVQAADERDTARQEQGLRRLDAERENLWAALRWARDRGDAAAGDQLAGALTRLAEGLALPAVRRSLTPLVFELRRLRLPAYAALERRLVAIGEKRTLVAGADLYQIVGDQAAELALVRRLIDVEPDELSRAFAQVRLAWLWLIQNDVKRATELLEVVAQWATADGHEPLLLDVLLQQGYAHFKTGDCHGGRSAYARGLELLERLRPGLPHEIYQAKRQTALRGRGCVEHNADDNGACAATHREALALARARSDAAEEAVALVNLADAVWGCGLLGEALRLYGQAKEAAAAACYTSQSAFALLGLGAVLWSAGQHTAAATALEAGLALADDLGDAWSRAYGLAYLSNVRASLGDVRAALGLSREAVVLAQGVGAGYPQTLALLSFHWQTEVLSPGDPAHGQDVDAALAKARTLGLDGLALQLAWVRVLHRLATPNVSDDSLVAELEGLLEATRSRQPVKGAVELLALQVARALRGHRGTAEALAMGALIESLVGELSEARMATLDSRDRRTFRSTRCCWEVPSR